MQTVRSPKRLVAFPRQHPEFCSCFYNFYIAGSRSMAELMITYYTRMFARAYRLDLKTGPPELCTGYHMLIVKGV